MRFRYTSNALQIHFKCASNTLQMRFRYASKTLQRRFQCALDTLQNASLKEDQRMLRRSHISGNHAELLITMVSLIRYSDNHAELFQNHAELSAPSL